MTQLADSFAILPNGGSPAANVATPVHPLGSKARVLLTSVFGPYAQDDEYGSRKLNPMELYQNQVTRTQGPFSLRMFHRSWGIMLIQANIEAPCTVLDFPTLDRFIEELKTRQYDIIGISSIIPNLMKVKRMCKLIRHYQPNATIVIGGHIANVPDLDDRVNADHIVRGEGVRWFQRFLGEPDNRPFRHPLIQSGFGSRNMGISLGDRPNDIAASVIPSVGCPVGCNFCSTSAMFGGKGKFINFYETGDELFHIMQQLEDRMGVQSFFIMDENFLLHRQRALRLLELIEQNDKAWALYVFSSANILRSYTIEQLVSLGISWVWMGIEGKDSQYGKLQGSNTFELVRELQSHGIRVLGSTIIGLENHTMENIDEAIEYAAQHCTDFHQFMLYTPIPGTPLYAELSAQGRLKDESEYEFCDIHGQEMFNYRHEHIPAGAEAELMLRAFNRDFERNGPSTTRIIRTTLAGWKRYKNHPDARIRRRFQFEAKSLAVSWAAGIKACQLYYHDQPEMRRQMTELLDDIYAECGWKARLAGELVGRWVLRQIRKEEKRLAEGWSYEPSTFYDRNPAVTDNANAQLCRWAEPQAVRGTLRPSTAVGAKSAEVAV